MNICICSQYLNPERTDINPILEYEDGSILIQDIVHGNWLIEYYVKCIKCSQEYYVVEKEKLESTYKWKVRENEVNIYPDCLRRHKMFLRKALGKNYKVKFIYKLKRLPRGINYITWTTGQSEDSTPFKIKALKKDGSPLDIIAETRSLLGFVFRSLYWVKVGDKYKRFYPNRI